MATQQIDERGILVGCPSCGRRNRVAWARADQQGRCAQCKGPLTGPSLPLQVSSESQFRGLIDGSALPVLVDFWADWCGPCKMLAPELERLAAGSGKEFLVAKVDTEALPELAGRYGIRSIPSLLVFFRGRELARTAGVQPASALQGFVRQAMAA